ncbi:phage holin family protein [Streptomyces sp. NRRL B-3648]|uniref:phage holin family protein n=1 Tax=Streptomyces sp. NRRL B-3648 TaxID=1519493 RepID=UPI0006AE967C|nr:phage holin family protein [Streptomyces sp. NRRL B-3648]KOV96395.1 membrane protein [Streptomyces sp. NRRL B-3648]
MDRFDHLEHLDKHLVEELAQVARETVRDELREQSRKRRRTAVLYAASGAAALYAGGAVALAVGLALAIGLPGWAAALITAALLGVVAYALRGAAHSGHGHDHHSAHRVLGGTAPGIPPSGLGMPYPPMPQTPPETPLGPDGPHHRA